MIRRLPLLACVAGVALLVVPGLDWFSLGDFPVSGWDAAGAVMALPVLGVAGCDLAFRAMVARRAGRAATAHGAWLAVVGLVALALCTWVIARAPVGLSAGGTDLGVHPSPLPAAWVALGASAVMLAVGAVLARPWTLWRP